MGRGNDAENARVRRDISHRTRHPGAPPPAVDAGLRRFTRAVKLIPIVFGSRGSEEGERDGGHRIKTIETFDRRFSIERECKYRNMFNRQTYLFFPLYVIYEIYYFYKLKNI